MKLLIKGFIIGVGKIIPGVSGALLAITLGVYEKSLYAISNFFKEPIKHFKFLFPLGIGVVLSIPLTSKLILYLLNNFYVQVMLLFIGLITGGIVPIFKEINIKKLKISNYIAVFISFLFVISLSFIDENLFTHNINNLIIEKFTYFTIGAIDAATMIIPGISGTAVMMLLGIYDLLLSLLSSVNEVFNNLNLYIPYFLGIIVTIISLSKLISYLFNKKGELMYSGILGFSVSSLFLLSIELFNNYDIKLYHISLFILGLYISKLFENLK